MVVDTSAIVAAIGHEPDAAAYREAMLSVASMTISSVTALEARIVLHARHGPDAVSSFQEMLEDFSIIVVPFDSSLAKAAFDAFLRFGKGRHPASLNIVDCAAYATAKMLDEPLLFKGNDFSRTDVVAAL